MLNKYKHSDLRIPFLGITKRNKFIHPHKGKEMNIHSTLIHQSLNYKNSQIFISGRLDMYIRYGYYLAMKRMKLWIQDKT